MTNTLFQSRTVRTAPMTSDDLDELEFTIMGSWEQGDYALSITDDVDTTVVVGSLEQLQEVLDGLHQQMIRLRRYDASLRRAKSKLEGRLRG